ncbi:MAG: hypothetical protein QOI38_2053 [Sphingomonadales bacterium]|jgi:hypothetical protein|nr:hypothetical protein [Sphingomonadales bacterium]
MPIDYAAFAATGEVSEPLWRALRTSPAPASLDELHRRSRAHPTAISNRLRRWQSCGFVQVQEAEPPRYRIAVEAAHLAEPPFPGSLAADAWRALRKLGRAATFEEILAASGAADRPLYCRLRRWVEQGFVEVLPAIPRKFSLAPAAPDVPVPPKVNEQGEVKPQRRSAREKMWKAMRVLKTFDVPMLMMTAEVSRRSCDEFLNLLVRAGYVRLLGYKFKRVGPGRLDVVRDWSTYQLAQNTGPRHPTFSAFKSKHEPQRLTDHNTGASVELALRVPRPVREGSPNGR